MKARVFFVVLAVLIGCSKEQLRVQIFSLGAYNRQESILRSDLRRAFQEALDQKNLEIITADEYLLQCAVLTERNGNELKSALLRWNFMNFDYPEKNRIVPAEALDAIRVSLANRHDYKLAIRKCKQSFIKQLVKRKIVRVKKDLSKLMKPLIL